MAGGVLDSSQVFTVKVISDTSEAERGLSGLGKLADKPIKTRIVSEQDRDNPTSVLDPDLDVGRKTSVRPTSVFDSDPDDNRVSVSDNRPTSVLDPDRDNDYQNKTRRDNDNRITDSGKDDTPNRYPKLLRKREIDSQPDQDRDNDSESFFGKVASTGGRAAQKGIDKTGDVVSGGLTAASKGLESFGHSLHEIQGPLGVIGDKMNTAKIVTEGIAQGVSKLPLVGEALGKIGTAAAGLIDPLKGVLESLTAMTAKSNPGLFSLWQKSLDNVQATIGSRFVPVLKQMIQITDKAGDTLASILPNAAELEKDLQPLISALAELNKEESEFNAKTGPTIREGVRTVIQVLSTGMGLLVEASIKASKALSGLTGSLFEMIGLGDIFKGGGGAQEGERHRDFAARPASYQDVNSYESKFQTDAFGSGGTVADMKPGEITGPLADIVTKIGILVDAFKAVAWEKLQEGWEWLKGAWKGIEVGWGWLKDTAWPTLTNSFNLLIAGIAGMIPQILEKIQGLPGQMIVNLNQSMAAWSRTLGLGLASALPKPPWER